MAVAAAPLASSLAGIPPAPAPPTPVTATGPGLTPQQQAALVNSFGEGSFGVPTTQPKGVAVAPPAPPATPAPQQFMTPAMQQYVNAFNAAQGQQQQALNAGLLQAMQGLGQRRDAAANVAATVPASFRQAYADATKNAQYAAQQSGFGHPTIGATADQPLIAAANAQEQAAGLASQPLLNAGIAADYSQGQTALANTNMANQADLASQKAGFNQQLLLSAAQFQQAQQSQQAGYAHDLQMAKLQSQLGLQNYRAENPNAALTPQQQEQMQNQAQLDQQAIKNGFTSYADQTAAEKSTDYSNAIRILAGEHGLTLNGASGIKGRDKPTIVKSLSSQPNVLKALVANGYLTAADVYAAG